MSEPTETTWDEGDAELEPNLLQKIVSALVEQGTTAELALSSAALLVRKSGCRVENPTVGEVMALAIAGEALARERTAWLVRSLQRPSLALKDFDGGESERAEVLAEFRAELARGGA